MSIIHEALKKVQQSMKLVKNPEDIVEVLPSSNPKPVDSQAKGGGIRTFFIVLGCLVLIAGSVFLGLRQVQQQYPGFLAHISLPSNQELKKNVEETLKKNPLPALPGAKPKEPQKTAAAQPQFLTPEPPPVLAAPQGTEQIPQTPAMQPAVAPSPAIPMAQTETLPALETVLNVQGIMAHGGGNVALINNNVYEEGSQVKGAKILKINPHDLVVEYNGQQKTISVNK